MWAISILKESLPVFFCLNPYFIAIEGIVVEIMTLCAWVKITLQLNTVYVVCVKQKQKLGDL